MMRLPFNQLAQVKLLLVAQKKRWEQLTGQLVSNLFFHSFLNFYFVFLTFLPKTKLVFSLKIIATQIIIYSEMSELFLLINSDTSFIAKWMKWQTNENQYTWFGKKQFYELLLFGYVCVGGGLRNRILIELLHGLWI